MQQTPSSVEPLLRSVEPSRAGAAVRAAAVAPDSTKRKRTVRSWWLRQLHTWHWISAAVSLTGMLLFALTGVTLNHAASIGATPKVTQHATALPPRLVALLKPTPAASDAPLPDAVAAQLVPIVGLDARGKPAEWSEDAYVALPGPGRDAWLSINRSTGAVTSEITDRGWVSYLNDLHKGRNTGPFWFWFIDLFAGACVLFTVTGFLLLQLHSKHRPSTWPLVGLSLAVPVLIALFFIH